MLATIGDVNLKDHASKVYTTSNTDKNPSLRTEAISDSDINITNRFFDRGIDLNDNSKYDYIEIAIEINVTIGREYHFNGELNSTIPGGDLYFIWIGNEDYLPGIYNISFRVESWWCYLQGNGSTYFIEKLQIFSGSPAAELIASYDLSQHLSQIYYHRDLEEPEISFTGNQWSYAVDEDSDGLFDYIDAFFEIYVSQEKEYSIRGRFEASGYSNEWYIFNQELKVYPVGFHNVSLRLHHTYIHWHAGNITYRIWDILISELYQGSWYNVYRNSEGIDFAKQYNRDDFTPPVVSLLAIHDSGVDIDNDSLYDYLKLDFTVNVTKSVKVEFKHSLFYTNETHGGYIYHPNYWAVFQLEPGIQNMTICYLSDIMFNSDFYGQLKVISYYCQRWNDSVDILFDEPISGDLNGSYNKIEFSPESPSLFKIISTSHSNEDGNQIYYKNDDINIEIEIEKKFPDSNYEIETVAAILDSKTEVLNQKKTNSTHDIWFTTFELEESGNFPVSIYAEDSFGITDEFDFSLVVHTLPSIDSLTVEPGTTLTPGSDVTFTVVLNKGSFDINLVTLHIENIGTYDLALIASDTHSETYKYQTSISNEGTFLCTLWITDINGKTVSSTVNIIVAADTSEKPSQALTPGFDPSILFIVMLLLIGYAKNKK